MILFKKILATLGIIILILLSTDKITKALSIGDKTFYRVAFLCITFLIITFIFWAIDILRKNRQNEKESFFIRSWRYFARLMAKDVYEEEERLMKEIDNQKSGNPMEILSLNKIQCRSIVSFNRSSTLYSRIMSVFTLILIILTVVLLLLAK